jgi:hypothetical protein
VALVLVLLTSAAAALHSVTMAADVVSELVSMVDLVDSAASVAMVASLDLDLTPLP